jgi:hypothetical protein
MKYTKKKPKLIRGNTIKTTKNPKTRKDTLKQPTKEPIQKHPPKNPNKNKRKNAQGPEKQPTKTTKANNPTTIGPCLSYTWKKH